jgi:hypothetical protein
VGKSKSKVKFVPFTPSGSALFHIARDTENKAWAALLKDAAHMPYRGIEEFKARGYTVERMERTP